MIGTSRLEYCLIRASIFGLRCIAPLSLSYSAANAVLYCLKGTLFRLPPVFEAIAVSETLFFLCVYTPYRMRLQREAVHPPPPSRQERRELFARCNENVPDPELYVQKWFLGAPLREIKRDNWKEFLLWAFFNRGGAPGDDDEELEEYVVATEKLLGRPLEEGRGSAIALRLTLDKVDMLHRSLTWYMVRGKV